ncbi:G-patch domain-containing protein [Fusarium mundagurra]|uniref:G-patch domain-containing protein n=1 Tax=Fusarium mundagurra TaxID=1567541 RepID=A0A8H5Z113_9HYPO|nr:G-patch domain-containing protein [Fusarium mundagurra]
MQRYREDASDESHDEEDIPLHYKRAFGAGLKRQRVEFVPAQDPDAGTTTTITPAKSTDTSIGDLYASIVLKPAKDKDTKASEEEPEEICPDCKLPISSTSQPHEASFAHQVSLTHSHPPSALDRSRMGLKALKSQGWDPDARRGLGREGEGMRYPIKVVAKEDTLGIGATIPKEIQEKKKEEKPRPLNRKEAKQLAAKERQRHERLQGHHAVKEMPILGLAQGLTAGSEDSPGKTTLDNSAAPEAITAGYLDSEHRDANAISSDFESYFQSTELKH